MSDTRTQHYRSTTAPEAFDRRHSRYYDSDTIDVEAPALREMQPPAAAPITPRQAASQLGPFASRGASIWINWGPLLLALIVGLAFQGSRGLTETSETRYAECAREMLVSGNWIEPTLEFQPHWTKPPLAYWCIAAGMKIWGINAWGARLPGVAALLVATCAVLVAGRRLWGRRAGFVAAVAFTLGFPALGAHVVTTDIFLTAAASLAGAAYIFAVTATDHGTRRAYACAMWAAWGVAFMAKGPPALLPLLAIIPWNRMQPREHRAPLGDWLGLLCFGLVALPWYLAMLHRHDDLLSYYVGTEIVARVSSNLGHNRAWYKALEIYGPALLGATGVFGLWAAALAWTRGGWNRTAHWHKLWTARDARLLMVGWVLLPLIVFSLSRSKLHFYVLPLAMPLALLTGRVLAAKASWRHFRTVTAVSLLAFVGIKAIGAHLPNRRDMAELAREARSELSQMRDDAPVVFWDEPANHGMTFYLGLDPISLPERIAAGAKGKYETWTAAEFAERVRAGKYQHGALLILSGRKRESYDRALPGLPVEREHRGNYWHLLRIAESRQPAIFP